MMIEQLKVKYCDFNYYTQFLHFKLYNILTFHKLYLSNVFDLPSLGRFDTVV
jgi:hypothetical protein